MGLNTKGIVTNITEVPRAWVFEFYLHLEDHLQGQDVKIKSPFNPADTNPSCGIFYSNDYEGYRFRDFSAGIGGDGITLVQELFKLSSRFEASSRIVYDFNKYLKEGNPYTVSEVTKQVNRFKVISYEKRLWTKDDANYWIPYNISSTLLEQHLVFPLKSFTLSNGERDILVEASGLYGYFNIHGRLFKIYRPNFKEGKFIQVESYIQGYDQINPSANSNLIVLSSMKDLLAFKSLGYPNIDSIAPESENTKIPMDILEKLKSSYKNHYVLFDNDVAGKMSSEWYVQIHNFKPIYYSVTNDARDKDIARAIKQFGAKKIKQILTEIFIKQSKL